MAYKTPGVYVEEITTLPASVAEVETAIPAFIGYTEKASDNGVPITEPLRIKSLLEFRKYFGDGPEISDIEVQLSASNAVEKVSKKAGSYRYLMFDSLRMYFDNGGGDCYIVSVGTFGTSPSKNDIKAGLKKLEKFDEPTLILFPDATSLDYEALHSLQVMALQQCTRLQDRFGVFDLKEDTSGADTQWEEGVTAFRDKIGINNLKYGAAYTPWIQAGFERFIPRSALSIKKADGTALELTSLPGADDALVSQAITSLAATQASSGRVGDVLKTVPKANSDIQTDFNSLTATLSAEQSKASFGAVLNYMFGMLSPFGTWVTPNSAADSKTLRGNMALELAATLDSSVTDSLATLKAFQRAASTVTPKLADAPPAAYAKLENALIVRDASTLGDKGARYLSGLDGLFDGLTAEFATLKALAEGFPAANAERKKVTDQFADVGGTGAKLEDLSTAYKTVKDAFTATPSKATFDAVVGFLMKLFSPFGDWKAGDAAKKLSAEPSLVAALDRSLEGSVQGALQGLGDHALAAKEATLSEGLPGTHAAMVTAIGSPSTSLFGDAATTAARVSAALPKLTLLFSDITGALGSISDAAATAEKAADKTLYEVFPAYKAIIDSVRGKLNWLPPSGAIAGVYAATDRKRGVWKAPANVSLSNTTGLSYAIDHGEQERLNVDVTAGKSINAIRAFAGKGLLVWGARTLAGNDNEWRYVSVRRFYNMVEESVKKSTGWVVFEPNDSGTWIRVKAMIDNYLTDLWRRGALAGAKPEQAFFVNVGLGTTMTPVDILEGRMIIEIGMAAVRPAEFIILRFSHKLQEA